MKFKLNPIKQTALFLSIYSLGAIILGYQSGMLLHLGLTLGFALILFTAFSKITKKKKNIWDTVITGLILFLILHYTQSNSLFDLVDLVVFTPPETFKTSLLFKSIYAITATTIAMVFKFFVEFKKMPIINPVVAGLLGAILLLDINPLIPESWDFGSIFISWWGTNFAGYISLALIAIWIMFGLKKWRKYNVLISFLIAHGIIILFRGEPLGFLEFIYTDATIYFFAAIMLIEPKTSPLKKDHQIAYGIFAALLYNGFIVLGLPHYELLAIAGANVFNTLLRAHMMRPKKA
jgi:hypothetical protein